MGATGAKGEAKGATAVGRGLGGSNQQSHRLKNLAVAADARTTPNEIVDSATNAAIFVAKRGI